MRELYVKLYETALANLSFLIPVKGARYDAQSNLRFMLVGRATNGWDVKGENLCDRDYPDKHKFADGAVEILEKEGSFHERFPNLETYWRTSAFWQYSKEVYERLSGKKENDWYENIVWYNLYPIAPQIEGNPSEGFRKGMAGISAELLEEYIRKFNPTHILFATGWDWFKDIFINLIRANSELFSGILVEQSKGSLVDAKGICEGRKVVVAKHPERKRKEDYINQTLNAFTSIVSG